MNRKYFIDLHIHTALSPCASDDMTPNNIVNMAHIKGLDFIAITDHNSIGNIQAVINCAQSKSLLIIPGMEVESSEEVHLICLFPSIESAIQMDQLVQKNLPYYKNRPDIFGNQILFNEYDNVTGSIDKLLLTATSLSINEIKSEAESIGGVIFPAHVDRSSYSIISNLGFIPKDLNFSTIEISKKISKEEFSKKFSDMQEFNLISNSDAHDLGQISEAIECVELREYSILCLFDYLRQKNI